MPDVPPSQAKLIVVKQDGLYELSYKMLLRRGGYCAFGDGKEIAIGALAMGASTVKLSTFVTNTLYNVVKVLNYTLRR